MTGRRRGRSLVLLMAAAVINVVGAATYYVSPDGDDGNAGTSWATALKTPNAGFAKVNSNRGSTLIISNGVHQMTGDIGCYELYVPKGLVFVVQ